jgi:hypothetical protein
MWFIPLILKDLQAYDPDQVLKNDKKRVDFI